MAKKSSVVKNRPSPDVSGSSIIKPVSALTKSGWNSTNTPINWSKEKTKDIKGNTTNKFLKKHFR